MLLKLANISIVGFIYCSINRFLTDFLLPRRSYFNWSYILPNFMKSPYQIYVYSSYFSNFHKRLALSLVKRLRQSQFEYQLSLSKTANAFCLLYAIEKDIALDCSLKYRQSGKRTMVESTRILYLVKSNSYFCWAFAFRQIFRIISSFLC